MSGLGEWVIVAVYVAIMTLAVFVAAHQPEDEECPVPVPLEDCG